jgi:hypothetical protein
MHAESPRFSLLGWGTDSTIQDPVEEGAGELSFAWIAFAVDGTEVEELVAERAWFFLLGEDSLQRDRQFTELRSLRPFGFRAAFAYRLAKQTTAASGTLFEASKELIAKYGSQ